jgi:hypothetical protein
MDAAYRKELEKLALERMHATAHDQWSYAWAGEGVVILSYCPWSNFEEFDGDTGGLDLAWSKERLDLIERGEADPDENELAQWRDLKCRRAADAGEGYTVSIVPMTKDKQIEGFAVFMWHYGKASGDPPWLKGVFDSIDEAKASLNADGVISDVNP